ncbi:MAG: hypothetical protein QMD04_14810 [Anaerolineales bacterium]|nr:hypothetical protein [Anaerolineales bacterium]
MLKNALRSTLRQAQGSAYSVDIFLGLAILVASYTGGVEAAP